MQRQQDDATVTDAAIVLATAARSTNTSLLSLRQQLDDDDHASCAATKKTRWWSRLKAKLACFRPHGHPQRIVDASSETGAACADQAAASSSTSSYYHTRHAPQPALAFVAPPPSPESSALTSESPSPVVLLNANNISSTYSSPTASIFAVGPYAREPQQLVSPPAFSAGLTEPSTAPLTPPAEPACSPHLLATTPSSPEVPFARFLWPSVAAADQQQRWLGGGTEGLLHAYQLQQGSPILVSPGSTSSSPPSWAMQQQHPVQALNESMSLLDGGRIPMTEEGGDYGSGSASRNDDTHDDEVAKSGGEFVFGSNADAAAGGEVGSGGSSLALGEQWPFHLAHG